MAAPLRGPRGVTDSTVSVRGLVELNRALKAADKTTRAEFRLGFRKVAEPVRLEAERLALSDITRITEPWARMRTGVTTKAVYVAPRQRGIKSGRGDDPKRRPKFADLLITRSLVPALERKQGEVERGIFKLVDHALDVFNREA